MDSQSVKNVDTAQQKGYDAGKKVSGIKRHLTVDTQGLPHAIEVTTADVTDREGALWMFLLNTETLSAVAKLLVDSAYTGEPFAQRVEMILGAGVEVAKRSELHRFAVIPNRWVVERSSLSDFLCARGHEMIPKGKQHDRNNEHAQEDQETEDAPAIFG